MKAKLFLMILLIMPIVIMANFNVIAEAETNEEKGDEKTQENIYIPLWMQPETIIIYDENMNCIIVQGGELSEEEIAGREDIALIGLINTEPGFIAEPNTKIEYDKYGFHQNTYYLWPNAPDDYRLSNPNDYKHASHTPAISWVDHLVVNTVTYGEYLNKHTIKYQHNNLSRLSNNMTIGTGKISYYFETTNDRSHVLRKNDCAIRKNDCDVPGGTVVTVVNTYPDPTKIRIFYKKDLRDLPSSILEVWCGTNADDISNQAIKGISTRADLENVYSGKISFFSN